MIYELHFLVLIHDTHDPLQHLRGMKDTPHGHFMEGNKERKIPHTHFEVWRCIGKGWINGKISDN